MSRAKSKCIVTIGGKRVTAATHAIVIPDSATPQERHAAADLRSHLEQVTGEGLPIVTDSAVADRTPIIVGRSALLPKLGIRADFGSLGTEGIAIETAGPALALLGNKRGVLYACYTFLEDYLNCRWLAPDCTVLPRTGEFDLPAISRRYIPPLEYRATDYPNSREADWAVRNKMTSSVTELDEPRGGKVTYRGFVHTFNALVPPETYFEEHPEYYSEINGVRVGPDRSQLCLANPEVLRIAKQTVREWIQESPEASIFSVSQNDWENYCQCSRCAALAEEEGSQIGPILHFVNAIADDVAADYPDKTIDTLAYWYSRKPPKHVRPRPNVVIRLCTIECCFIHPLESDPYNASFVEDIKGWSEVSKRLWIWDYVINYLHTVQPFPNLYVLKPNINFFINHGVTGIYEEANYFSRGGELAELRSYIIAKTLWDPSYDTDRAIDEFVSGYYAQAADPIRQYLDLIHREVPSSPDLHVRIYADPQAYLSAGLLGRCAALFDNAEEAVANDPTLLHRVRVAHLPVIYAQIALGMEEGARKASLLDRFEETARAEGVTKLAEWGDLATLDAWVAAQRAGS